MSLSIGWILVAFWGALAAGVALVWLRPERVAPDRRRRPGEPETDSWLTGPAAALVEQLEGGLARTGQVGKLAGALERAGLRMRPGEFLLVSAAGVLSVAALVLVVAGMMVALVVAVCGVVVARMVLSTLAGRRRAAFADQLDDSLQLLAGSLRAGHSLLRAVDGVSRDAEPPTSLEFARIINETRVGRELGDSLDDTAERMQCEDFAWVAQAIAIHREVGGDLAEVLDTVGHTIRERNQIRRQVKALSAEGRLSGIVLMLLPVGVAGFLMTTNPGYLATLTHGILGWSLIGSAVLLMAVGGLWLRKVVSFKF